MFRLQTEVERTGEAAIFLGFSIQLNRNLARSSSFFSRHRRTGLLSDETLLHFDLFFPPAFVNLCILVSFQFFTYPAARACSWLQAQSDAGRSSRHRVFLSTGLSETLSRASSDGWQLWLLAGLQLWEAAAGRPAGEELQHLEKKERRAETLETRVQQHGLCLSQNGCQSVCNHSALCFV